MATSSDKKRAKSASQPARRASRGAKKQSLFVRAKKRLHDFMNRRPHRSFRLTRRRDYARSLKLPGYWAFTGSVLKVLHKNRKSFVLLGILYALTSLVFLGIGSQESFTELRQALDETGGELFEGNWGEIGKATLLAVSTIMGNISPSMTEAQQIYAVILGLIMWLSTIWLLRQRLAGKQAKVRDALYNAGAPIIPTALLFILLLVQLLPIALASVGYSAAQASGLLQGGVEAMLFWLAAAGLSILSLYWITSTFLSLIVVTLPGMYPLRALAIAGDMVVGRRLRILYRLAWMVFLIALSWIVVLALVILLDAGIKQLWPAIEWLPIVPIAILILTTASLISTATYIYMLYRRIVDDDAKPA